MEFRLPQELQIELLAYDPKLKALTRSEQPKKQTKKSKYPFGNPNDLIPADIIKSTDLQTAIDYINRSAAADRWQVFTKVVNIATPEANTITHAILYHYEQGWYAAWLPPKGIEHEYVYGYAYAYKDNETAWKALPSTIKREKEDATLVAYGRSQFYVKRGVVTKEDISKSTDDRAVNYWNIAGVPSYYQKSGNIYRAIKTFEKALITTIPTWSDSRYIFDRLRAKSLHKFLIPSCKELYAATWQPSAQSLLDLIDMNVEVDTYRYQQFTAWRCIRHIIDTPFFRKWIKEQCNECIKAFNDPATTTQVQIGKYWNRICMLLNRIVSVHLIWPDCPIDYYQNNIDVLLGTNYYYNQAINTNSWLREYMPVASFFSILNKFYEAAHAEHLANQHRRNYNYDEKLCINVYRFSELSDTLSMLTQVLATKELEPPKRWRITEFHDYVQGEAWKIKNPNQSLPQDLFPQPVKVTLDNETWTFFQPIDTHQLSSWGQAVRNCVGSAQHYAEDCRKKKHFLVLCMINGKPQFTIQLTVNMGLMSVNQIAGIANQRLDDSQKEQYTKAFGMALQSRTSLLKS